MSLKRKTLSLRINEELDMYLARQAKQLGISKNALIITLLNQNIGVDLKLNKQAM